MKHTIKIDASKALVVELQPDRKSLKATGTFLGAPVFTLPGLGRDTSEAIALAFTLLAAEVVE